jgi:hypothetical protein
VIESQPLMATLYDRVGGHEWCSYIWYLYEWRSFFFVEYVLTVFNVIVIQRSFSMI